MKKKFILFVSLCLHIAAPTYTNVLAQESKANPKANIVIKNNTGKKKTSSNGKNKVSKITIQKDVPSKIMPVKKQISKQSNISRDSFSINNQRVGASTPINPLNLTRSDHKQQIMQKIYANITRHNWAMAKNEAARSRINGMIEFVDLLKFSNTSRNNVYFDEGEIYEFLAHKYSIVNNEFVASKINRNISNKVIANEDNTILEIFSPSSLITKYKKNPSIINTRPFQTSVLKIWHTKKFSSASEESAFQKAFSKFFSKRDYDIRVEKLLWDGDIADIMRIINHASQNKKYEVKLRIDILNSRSFSELLEKLSSLGRTNYEKQIMTYDAVRWCEKNHMLKEKFAILERVPLSGRIREEQWWKLIKISIRELLGSKDSNHHKLAYKLALTHKEKLKTTDYVEIEFLLGFIAGSYIGDGSASVKHFYNSFKNAENEARIARAAYWLGLTSMQYNVKIDEKDWFKIAAKYPTTFYGQVAIYELGQKDSNFMKSYFTKVTNESIAQLESNPIFNYYYLALMTGNSDLANKLGKILILTLRTKSQVATAVHFANNLVMPEVAINMGKIAKNTLGVTALEALYPAPKYNNLRCSAPLALSIIRSESNFNPRALSPVGACGLMQIMPETGRKIASSLGLSGFSQNALFNTQTSTLFGSQYLKTLQNEWNGSMILSIASYNAGPHVASRWIETYGDPRNARNHYEILRWLENISYRETRYYVQGVLANYLIYMNILHPEKHYDLYRALAS